MFPGSSGRRRPACARERGEDSAGALDGWMPGPRKGPGSWSLLSTTPSPNPPGDAGVRMGVSGH